MRNRRVAISTLAVVFVLGVVGCSADTPQDESSPSQGAQCATSDQPSPPPTGTLATTAQVLEAVKAAACLKVVPQNVVENLTKQEGAAAVNPFECKGEGDIVINGGCAFGDPQGKKLMVIYGDSRARMWGATLEGVALQNHWKLRVFSKPGCPAQDLNFLSSETKSPDTECDNWHAATPGLIKAMHPDLVVVTSVPWGKLVSGSRPTTAQWQDGWDRTLSSLAQPGTKLAMLGANPQWENSSPSCLAKHVDQIQACSSVLSGLLDYQAPDGGGTNFRGGLEAEKSAAATAGALYVPSIPWVCTDRCEPVIAGMRAFEVASHFSQTYAVYLTGALSESLRPVLTP